ncbi:MAG: hypothetical protein Q9160_006172 [Pyrenula sp. 1 TL-2023]
MASSSSKSNDGGITKCAYIYWELTVDTGSIQSHAFDQAGQADQNDQTDPLHLIFNIDVCDTFLDCLEDRFKTNYFLFSSEDPDLQLKATINSLLDDPVFANSRFPTMCCVCSEHPELEANPDGHDYPCGHYQQMATGDIHRGTLQTVQDRHRDVKDNWDKWVKQAVYDAWKAQEDPDRIK